MKSENVAIQVTEEEEELLAKLVDDELDRRVVAIDDVIQRAYDVVPAKHTGKAIAEVRAAILELVRSPMAALEAKLEWVEVKPGKEPVEVLLPEEEAALAEEPEPGKEPGKSKA